MKTLKEILSKNNLTAIIIFLNSLGILLANYHSLSMFDCFILGYTSILSLSFIKPIEVTNG